MMLKLELDLEFHEENKYEQKKTFNLIIKKNMSEVIIL